MSKAPHILLVTAGRFLTLTPPVGLLQLAAVLRAAGAQVRLFDLAARPGDEAAFLRAARTPAVLWVGFSAFTANLPEVERLARSARAAGATAPMFLGGVHATALPERTLAEGPWDGIVVGEGEPLVVPLTERLAAGASPAGMEGLLLPGAAAPSGPPLRVADLGSLPLPAWDLVDLDDYQGRPWQLVKRGRRVAPIVTSRGCPFRCRFCAATVVSGARLRFRPVEQVLAEIALLTERYGVDELHIVDDAFNARLDRARTLLEALARRGGPLLWKTPNGLRVDRWDPDFLGLVRRTGGYQVGFGIESGDPGVLAANRKQLDLDAAREAIAAFSAAGISTFGLFVLGLPGEDRDSLVRTRRYAARSALDHAHVSLAVPYPGSALYDELRDDPALAVPWDEYRHTRVFPTCGLSAGERVRAIRRFYAQFYAFPRRAVGLARVAWRTGPAAFARVAGDYFTAHRAQG